MKASVLRVFAAEGVYGPKMAVDSVHNSLVNRKGELFGITNNCMEKYMMFQVNQIITQTRE